MLGIGGQHAYPIWMFVVILNMASMVATLTVREWNANRKFQDRLETTTTFLRYFTPVLWIVSCVLCIVLAVAHDPIAWPVLGISSVFLLHTLYLARHGIGGVYSKSSH